LAAAYEPGFFTPDIIEPSKFLTDLIFRVPAENGAKKAGVSTTKVQSVSDTDMLYGQRCQLFRDIDSAKHDAPNPRVDA
jgi:hypothetical protein